MKIKTEEMSYEKVISLPKSKHKNPKKPNVFFRTLLKVVSGAELKKSNFKLNKSGMEKLPKKQPALYLMNHSSFIDLKVAADILYPRPFNIVCTSDGFVGKESFMRSIGCIPTKKFVIESLLVRDLIYALKGLKSSVLMYPEASYSFDGTETSLPGGLGKCIKLLGVPVVLIKTEGAFAHDPLYNNLQVRDVDISAEMKYLLSPEEIKQMSVAELDALLKREFTFDYFKWQQENGIKIKEPFRADYLNRVLFKCPHCLSESGMAGKGTLLTCGSCGKSWELTEEGFMKAVVGETEFAHIPDWYRWERECVRASLLDGSYRLDVAVDIKMMVDTNCVYSVGIGRLVHTSDGFFLTGCDGKLSYTQKPLSSYSLYSDYYWYEIGDMICLGNTDALYYCFPTEGGDVVARTRLAAEELYKLAKAEKSLKSDMK